MSNFFDALRAGAKAALGSGEPGEFEIANRRVRCTHCGGTQFNHRHVGGDEMHGTAYATTALICQGCSHVELFADMPMRV